jgi:hypothetical protein
MLKYFERWQAISLSKIAGKSITQGTRRRHEAHKEIHASADGLRVTLCLCAVAFLAV